MTRKTEAERLEEELLGGKPTTPEEAKMYYEDRMNNQPPMGADGQGNIRTFPIVNGKAQIPDDYFDFVIIDETPAEDDISDINDWDEA